MPKLKRKTSNLVPVDMDQKQNEVSDDDSEGSVIQLEMEDPYHACETNKYLFVSDMSLSNEVKQKLDNMKVSPCTDAFINRDCKELVNRGITNIWINLSSKAEKKWLELNLKKCVPFKPIVVHKGTSKQKWISEVSKINESPTVKYKRLKQYLSLDGKDLIDKISDNIELSDVVTCLERLCGLGKKHLQNEVTKN